MWSKAVLSSHLVCIACPPNQQTEKNILTIYVPVDPRIVAEKLEEVFE